MKNCYLGKRNNRTENYDDYGKVGYQLDIVINNLDYLFKPPF